LHPLKIRKTALFGKGLLNGLVAIRGVQFSLLNGLVATRGVQFNLLNGLVATSGVQFNLLNRLVATSGVQFNLMTILWFLALSTWSVKCWINWKRSIYVNSMMCQNGYLLLKLWDIVTSMSWVPVYISCQTVSISIFTSVSCTSLARQWVRVYT